MPRPRRAGAADLGQDDDVARGDAAARDVDERRGGDDDDAQVAGDRAGASVVRQHARVAERLRQLVAAGRRSASLRPAASTITDGCAAMHAEDGRAKVD